MGAFKSSTKIRGIKKGRREGRSKGTFGGRKSQIATGNLLVVVVVLLLLLLLT